MGSGNRYVHLPIEIEFLLDNLERTSRHLTFDSPIEYVVWNIGEGIGEFRSIDDAIDFRGLILLVEPAPTTPLGITPLNREIILCSGVVVGEETKEYWEEFAPLVILTETGDDAGREGFILILRTLPIQDAILFVFESDAAETVRAILCAGIGVNAVRGSMTIHAKKIVVATHVAHTLVAMLCETEAEAIHAIMTLLALCAVPHALGFEEIEEVIGIFAAHQILPFHIFALDEEQIAMRESQKERTCCRFSCHAS
jgi:hypothetical protein